VSDTVRRLTGDQDGRHFPLDVERVGPDRLENGDRVLLRRGETVPRDGHLVATLTGHDGSPSASGCLVGREDGTRERRTGGDALSAGETVLDSSVVLQVGGARGVPWWLPRSVAGAGAALWSRRVRVALSLLVVVLGFLGTGLGGFNPVQVAMETGGLADDFGGDPEPVTDTTTDGPGPVPTVTVVPPTDRPTATHTPTATPTTPGSATTGPGPTATVSATPTESGAATRTASGTATRTASETTTATPVAATATPTPVTASLSVDASDPPAVRSDDGTVGSLGGTVGGRLDWTTDRVDSVTLVVQVYVPDRGWAEVRRTSATGTSPLDLGAVLGAVTYADGSRAGAFANPDPGTVRRTTGRVAVTAVLFDGGTEVARATAEDAFEVSVRNVAFDLDMGPGGNGSGTGTGGSGASASLASAEQVAPGTAWVNRGTLTNTGTVPGRVRLTDLTVVGYENGLVGPEAAVDTSGGDPGRGAGELGPVLEVRVAVERANGSRTYVFGDATTYRPLSELDDEPVAIADLAAGESATLVVEYEVAASAGNEIQSDSVTIDFGFTMVELS